MGRIPESTIQEIRSRTDIVGLIGRYVELRRAGSNWKGLCPFHGEKTPSFNVNPDRQFFHCFGCHEGGDAIGFLMKFEGLEFIECVRSLAADCGVEIQETSSGDRGISEQLYAANDVAQRLYREALVSDGLDAAGGRLARDYLKGRGFGEDEIERFGIGYAPDRWDAVVTALKQQSISGEIGERAGLLKRGNRGYYDLLRGRLTFPIHDVRGRVVGFGGRALGADQEPKYLNTPETPVFRKRETFYGFPAALPELRRAKRAIICEGYFDQLALVRAGLGEALATCGTALTADHGTQLSRRTAEVVLLFDGDDAGRKAMERSLLVLLPQGLRVRAAILPLGEDPDDYLTNRGADALRELVDQSRDAVDEVMARAVDLGCATPAQKADVVNHVVPLLGLIPDGVERVEYGRRLANWTATDEPAVQASVRAASRGATSPVEVTRVEPRRASGDERHLHELAVLLFRHPALASEFDRPALEALIPEGSWKAVIGALLDASEGAANSGTATSTDAGTGASADLFTVEVNLDEDSKARLREAAVDEELFRGEMRPESAIEAVVANFEKRHIDARLKELTRRMADPGADHDAILQEKSTFLRYKQKLKAGGLALTRFDEGSRAADAPAGESSEECPPF